MHDHPEHHPFEVETEQPSNLGLLIKGLLVGAAFFGSGIVLTSVYYRKADEYMERAAVRPPADVVELRQMEQERLTTYGWVDRAKGEVRIPIDQAMKLMIEGQGKTK
jgi:heme O synthase-like polyprenyltransferase